jgi:hypothetical protein
MYPLMSCGVDIATKLCFASIVRLHRLQLLLLSSFPSSPPHSSQFLLSANQSSILSMRSPYFIINVFTSNGVSRVEKTPRPAPGIFDGAIVSHGAKWVNTFSPSSSFPPTIKEY